MQFTEEQVAKAQPTRLTPTEIEAVAREIASLNADRVRLKAMHKDKIKGMKSGQTKSIKFCRSACMDEDLKNEAPISSFPKMAALQLKIFPHSGTLFSMHLR